MVENTRSIEDTFLSTESSPLSPLPTSPHSKRLTVLRHLFFATILSFIFWLILDSLDAVSKWKLIAAFPEGPLPVSHQISFPIVYGSTVYRFVSALGDGVYEWFPVRLWPRPLILPLYQLLPSYDFVVTGAGAGGCAAAARLAEMLPTADILLLEAGGYPLDGFLSPELLPAAALLNQGGMNDWQHKTVKQKFGLEGLRDRQSLWPTGKALGGSTTFNFMIVHHGVAEDWKLWELCLNDTQWGLEAVEEEFEAMEEGLTNRAGRVPVDRDGLNSLHSAFGRELINAAVQAGFELVVDYTKLREATREKKSKGSVSALFLNKRNGKRVSMFRALLHPFLQQNWHGNSQGWSSRPGRLHVVPYAHVTEITWEKDKPNGPKTDDLAVVTGVEFVMRPPHRENVNFKDLNRQTVRVQKEVIMGAGAVGTAKILLQSGVGPAEYLRNVFGKERQFVNLPGVGRHLQDHAYSPVLLRLHEKHKWRSLSPKNAGRLGNLFNLMRGKGVLTSPGANTQLLISNVNSAAPSRNIPEFCQGLPPDPVRELMDKTPDLQVLFYEGLPSLRQLTELMNLDADSNIATLGSLEDDWGLSQAEVWRYIAGEQSLLGTLHEWRKPLLLTTPVVLHPQSHGTVRLGESADPLASPEIDPGYLGHARDLQVMREGRRAVQRVAKEAPDLIAAVLQMACPKEKSWSQIPEDVTEKCENNAEDEINNFFEQRIIMTLYHPAGTCRMGRNNDPMACCDSQLRVRKFKNLRIADSSAMPELISGNTALATALIGRKAANFIVNDWKSAFSHV